MKIIGKFFLQIFFTLFEDCLYFIEAIVLLDFISDLLLKKFEFFIYFLYWDYFETGTILKLGLFWNRDYFERDYFGRDYFGRDYYGRDCFGWDYLVTQPTI